MEDDNVYLNIFYHGGYKIYLSYTIDNLTLDNLLKEMSGLVSNLVELNKVRGILFFYKY